MRVSFTGHRPDKISEWRKAPERVERTIRENVAAQVVELAGQGAEEFLSGMAPGLDLWAADEVLRLRAEGVLGDHTRLTLLVPYPGFEHTFEPADRALFGAIVERADDVVFVCPKYQHGCYQLRNAALVERCDVVVAYYEGAEGGTRQTIKMALKSGRRVVNLHREAELFG